MNTRAPTAAFIPHFLSDMQALPSEILDIICVIFHERGGDLRVLMRVCRRVREAAARVKDQRTARMRASLDAVHAWQRRCSGKLAVTGIACLWRLHGMPAFVEPPFEIAYLGDETDAVPHPVQEGVLLPFSDTVVSFGDFSLRRSHRACTLEEYLQDSEPISSLCIGYTDPANIVFSPFEHPRAKEDQLVGYLHPQAIANMDTRVFGTIELLRRIGIAVVIPYTEAPRGEVLLDVII